MTHKYPSTKLIVDMMSETGYDEKQTAAYLGVPKPTLMNWLAERREMPYVAERLLNVLGCLRVLAPALHAHFEPPAPKPDMRKKENWTEDRAARPRRRGPVGEGV